MKLVLNVNKTTKLILLASELDDSKTGSSILAPSGNKDVQHSHPQPSNVDIQPSILPNELETQSM